jgi:hypothetical protein
LAGRRDHSWGVRAEMRTDETSPPLKYYPPSQRRRLGRYPRHNGAPAAFWQNDLPLLPVVTRTESPRARCARAQR